jgi:hypothetical protein
MGRVAKIGMAFSMQRRAGGGGGEDSMFQFRLKRGDDGMKCYQKMKRRRQVHVDSMGRKCDTTQQRGNVDRRRDDTEEGEREETTPVELMRTMVVKRRKPTRSIQLLNMDGKDLKQQSIHFMQT